VSLGGRPPGRWVYVNGALVERAEAALPALDRGLLHGYGLFETMRSYGGRVFRLDAHYARMLDGARVIGLGVPLALDEVETAVGSVLAKNGIEDARLRLTVTAGPAGEGQPSVVLAAAPLTDYPAELYDRGMSAVTSEVRRNETSPLSRVKSLSSLDNVLAREEARRRGFDEAVLLNTLGLVAEGSSTNVFIVRGEELITPGLDSGVLAGVTRAAVLELTAEVGLTAVEGDVVPEALAGADEAFLTNSVMEVMPLVSLDGLQIGDGHPGPATVCLSRLYGELVRRETAAGR
jgi:branched-chain amino acid aminotransferase